MFDSYSYIASTGFVHDGFKITIGAYFLMRHGNRDSDSVESCRYSRIREKRFLDQCELESFCDIQIRGTGEFVRLQNGVVLVAQQPRKGGLTCHKMKLRERKREHS
jgi:hypothetical protein